MSTPNETCERGRATTSRLGAGPAGLTAAYALARRGVRPIVLEADDVGGAARTVERDGWRFDSPLRASNVFANLGLIEAIRCVASYAAARIRPPRDRSTFEGWVAARFGWRLYRMFSEPYTEKVWGAHPTPARRRARLSA